MLNAVIAKQVPNPKPCVLMLYTEARMLNSPLTLDSKAQGLRLLTDTSYTPARFHGNTLTRCHDPHC